MPDLTGNWQIQSFSNSVTNPLTGVTLLGALESSGSNVSGTFRFSNIGQLTCSLDQVANFSGSISSNSKLTLTSATLPNGTTIKLSLAISGGGPYSGTGTIEVDGSTCAVASTPALGEEFANASGNYTGTLTPGTLAFPASGTSGTGSLTLTQSNTPGSDGQFSTTGTLDYQFGLCSGSVTLTGTVSGGLVTLSNGEAGFTTSAQRVSFLGAMDSAASKLTASFIFVPASCSTDSTSSASYVGDLARQ